MSDSSGTPRPSNKKVGEEDLELCVRRREVSTPSGAIPLRFLGDEEFGPASLSPCLHGAL